MKKIIHFFSPKHKTTSTLLIILVLSISLSFPLSSITLNTATNFANIAPASMPIAARVGIDGPRPLDVSYSSRQAIGTYNLIVILVEFTDETSIFSPSQVRNNAINELDNYYDEISYGLTQVDGVATNWLSLGQAREYYVDGTSFPSDPKFDMVQDAISLADPTVDFTLYDGVTIIHAGEGQELSHDWKDYWSSEWWNFNIPTNDGVSITRASVSPEQSTPGDPSYVGVLAHEFGHDLGLPDLYDVTYSGAEYVGYWGLMAKGSWNGPLGVGDQPSHMMGWSKAELGWINGSRIREVGTDLTTVIDPLELPTSGVHLVRINVTSQRYYLLEVRRKIGYDASLPGIGAGGEGVVLTYIDETLQSGNGIVKVIDSHPMTPSKSDGAFGIGLGEVNSYVSSSGQFSMVVENAVGSSYNVSIIRAFMEFITPLDGSAILSPSFTIEWTGSAAGPGIDHYELYFDGVLNYTGLGTSQAVSGVTPGLHNATLVMELAGTGRRLSIQSIFVVDLAAPNITAVSHSPDIPGFGDPITVNLEATDDTWIVNATIFYQRQGDTRWYHVDMTNISGSEWRGVIGTFLPGVTVTYYVAVTDAGGRTVSDDNSGAYYSFIISGIGLTVWLIIAAAVILIAVLFICWQIQRRRRPAETLEYIPPKEPLILRSRPSRESPDVEPSAQPPTPIRTGFCYHCGAPLTPNAIFCGYCGRPTE